MGNITCTKNLVKIGHIVPEIDRWMARQTEASQYFTALLEAK